MNTGNSFVGRLFQTSILLCLLLASLLPAGAVQAQEREPLAPCGQPPAAANWTINASCDLSADTIVPRNVTITNNATVSVPAGRWLNVDFTTYYLRILPGSKVLSGQAGGCTRCRWAIRF